MSMMDGERSPVEPEARSVACLLAGARLLSVVMVMVVSLCVLMEELGAAAAVAVCMLSAGKGAAGADARPAQEVGAVVAGIVEGGGEGWAGGATDMVGSRREASARRVSVTGFEEDWRCCVSGWCLEERYAGRRERKTRSVMAHL